MSVLSRLRSFNRSAVSPGPLRSGLEILEARAMLSADLPVADPDAVILAIQADAIETETALESGFVPVAWAPLQETLVEIEHELGQEVFQSQQTQILYRTGDRWVAMVGLQPGLDPEVVAEQTALVSDVLWASPNWIYDAPGGANPGESQPNDPFYNQQYYPSLIGADAAMEEIGSVDQRVVVAVTDEGFDLDHVDLDGAIWTNSAEASGKPGIDDDGNGYIDDIHGWDVANGDNDPYADVGGNHATHISGIIAATANNGIGIAGVASEAVEIMPIRIWSPTSGWSSSLLASGFAYAAASGAQIISTSLNIDPFANDMVAHDAFAMIHDAGILHINSAGNGRANDPDRVAFTESLLVASTDANDRAASFTNYGQGVDISAPGLDIFSLEVDDTYDFQSGTSMSAPIVAGAAAMIWAENPSWNRDQVAAQLLGTAKSIDALNSSKYQGRLGAGRVDIHAAVTTQQLPAPVLGKTVGLPGPGAWTNQAIDGFHVNLVDVFDTQTANDPDAFQIVGDGPDNVFGTADDLVVPLRVNGDWADGSSGGYQPYQIGTNELVFEFAPLEPDTYQFRAMPWLLQDPFGTQLDGDGDGQAGGMYVREFTIYEAPGNDDLDDAFALDGQLVSVHGQTIGATSEPGEGPHANDPGQLHSVWYSWEAPDSGLVTVSAEGEGFAVLAAAYLDQDDTLVSLGEAMASQSDQEISFEVEVEQGQTLLLVVDGKGSSQGRFTLELNLDPTDLLVPVQVSAGLTGLSLDLGAAFDPTTINVADSGFALLGAPDISVEGPGGQVRGHLVLDPEVGQVEFQSVTGFLEPGDYQVTVRGAEDGFRSPEGVPLDVDADGIAGGLHVTNLVVQPRTGLIVSTIPDALVKPGQSWKWQGTGLPVTVTDGDDLDRLEFTLLFDPELVQIQDVLPSTAIEPFDFDLQLTFLAPGRIEVALDGLDGELPEGTVEIVRLVGSLENSTPYGVTTLLDLDGVVGHSHSGYETIGDENDAVLIAGLEGDFNGSGSIDGSDVTVMGRSLILGQGFVAFPLADPIWLGDYNGNGIFSGSDVTSLGRQVLIGNVEAFDVLEIVSSVPSRGLVGGQGQVVGQGGVIDHDLVISANSPKMAPAHDAWMPWLAWSEMNFQVDPLIVLDEDLLGDDEDAEELA